MITFITVTRYATARELRVNPAAIAYIDAGGDGSVIAFGSGESVRVAEPVDTIERRVDAAASFLRAEADAARSTLPPELEQNLTGGRKRR